MLALMITEAEARAAEADAAARRERDTAKVRDGETVEGTCACLATSAIPCSANMGVESFRAHTVTHLCLPAPPPRLRRSSTAHSVSGPCSAR